MATALQYLMNGSIHTAVYMVYTEVMGLWWIVLLHVFFIGIVGFETKDESITAGYALITSLLLKKYSLLPVWGDYVVYTIVVLSIAILLYNLFRGDR